MNLITNKMDQLSGRYKLPEFKRRKHLNMSVAIKEMESIMNNFLRKRRHQC
jgi:hypothetical protein